MGRKRMPKGVYKHHPHQLFRKGNSAAKGIKRSAETREKMSLTKIGDKNPAWKGGRRVMYSNTGKKYMGIWNPDHPFATKAGYIREHRLVMEKKLGRYLKLKEVVHHKDRDRLNNLPDNLELFSNNVKHMSYHNSYARN